MTQSRNGHVRADARRNRAAIVTAARAAVEELGDEVPLEQIARRAQVNARTLFRHFPTRDDLLAAVLEDYFAERVEPVLLRAAADPDPHRALVTVLTETTAAVVEHPGMLALISGGTRAADIMTRHLRPLAGILSRARQAGVVRADLTPDDFPCLVTMLVASAGHAGRGWSRYLALMLDSLPPAAAHTPLPPAGT
ncbi:TetR/AcrR family transcriptional regulator [Streptomyces johnsoniae]|uniref:TetR/AcrR family transcriptional regulator n=1 Tax=Streptomyces johnsoniae TaxID=3075532 RepID=A0ABU2SCI7_9ACTN|nr:TetR/AcrR family transcriptional regulator [Streptomyces sp. DSM 41886]MDT0446702.1 TetR/AcrR family transcriptional regulator [Streptomyces sp. DSM 41886]